MIDLIFFTVVFIALVIGSVHDWRTHEVPDWLNYSLMSAGIGLRLVYSFLMYDYSLILEGLLGLAAGVAVGYLMYYTGQWGGGDSKMLMGIGALIGLNYQSSVPLLAILFVNFLLAGAVYGIGWLIYYSYLNRSKFVKCVRNEFRLSRRKLWLTLSVSIIFFILSVYDILFILVSLLTLCLYFLWLTVVAVEQSSLYKTIRTIDLVEGDWVADPKVEASRYGVTRSEIDKMLRDKVLSVRVRYGIPFVPSFLIGYVFTLLFRDELTVFVLTVL